MMIQDPGAGSTYGKHLNIWYIRYFFQNIYRFIPYDVARTAFHIMHLMISFIWFSLIRFGSSKLAAVCFQFQFIRCFPNLFFFSLGRLFSSVFHSCPRFRGIEVQTHQYSQCLVCLGALRGTPSLRPEYLCFRWEESHPCRPGWRWRKRDTPGVGAQTCPVPQLEAPE